ncbi:peptidoglycan D,D-transpeptidase FtsI family protein [Listeria costaricensis]|uniref:peptidoglycan D,D-transpeptidase FtsI family protein n=1 Tax=Listeria costaricensis TaxID=2026604 RepID=UPI000C081E89|nr:penicillin-binding protein 2 [Listeria costaricensis]
MKLNFRKKKRENKKKKQAVIPLRLNVLFFVIFILFSILILRLGVVQIVQGDTYKRQLEETDNVEVTKNMPRGVIYDRNYNLLVGNTAVNSITYTRSQQTPTSETLQVAQKLNNLITVEPEKLTERDLQDYWILTHEQESLSRLSTKEQQLDASDAYKKQVEKVTDADLQTLNDTDMKVATIFKKMTTGYAMTESTVKNKDVTDEEIARVSENMEELPGVDTTTDWNRFYTYDQTLRSVLGSVSSAKEGLPKEKADYYLSQGYSRNDRVGKSYLEEQYESVLAGQKSKSESVLDQQGNIIETVQKYEGSKGKDLVLSIDVEFQQAVDEIIKNNIKKGKGYSGSDLLDRAFVVAMDPYSGQVLALSGQQLNDEGGFDDFALGNFTTAYNMGSAVKGATVLGGMMSGAISDDQVFVDQPIYLKGTPTKSSWFNRTGAGNRALDTVGALEISSNSYMYQTAMKMGGANYVPHGPLNAPLDTFDKMRYYYNQFGLGVKTGIDLPGERGAYPSTDDTIGKILDFAIGQYDPYTTLQMAQYVSTVANGGSRIAPTMVKEIRNPSNVGDTVGTIATSSKPKVLNKVGATDSEIDLVKKGFYQVTHGSDGTARTVFTTEGYDVAGKTGTAQGFYDGPKESSKMAPVWNTTFVGYAPTDKPEIAIAVVVPWEYRDGDGYTDSKINMSISKEVFDKYFELKQNRAKENKDTSNVNQPINNKDKVTEAQAKAKAENK